MNFLANHRSHNQERETSGHQPPQANPGSLILEFSVLDLPGYIFSLSLGPGTLSGEPCILVRWWKPWKRSVGNSKQHLQQKLWSLTPETWFFRL